MAAPLGINGKKNGIQREKKSKQVSISGPSPCARHFFHSFLIYSWVRWRVWSWLSTWPTASHWSSLFFLLIKTGSIFQDFIRVAGSLPMARVWRNLSWRCTVLSEVSGLGKMVSSHYQEDGNGLMRKPSKNQRDCLWDKEWIWKKRSLDSESHDTIWAKARSIRGYKLTVQKPFRNTLRTINVSPTGFS